jgi:hypothetical protein
MQFCFSTTLSILGTTVDHQGPKNENIRMFCKDV